MASEQSSNVIRASMGFNIMTGTSRDSCSPIKHVFSLQQWQKQQQMQPAERRDLPSRTSQAGRV